MEMNSSVEVFSCRVARARPPKRSGQPDAGMAQFERRTTLRSRWRTTKRKARTGQGIRGALSFSGREGVSKRQIGRQGAAG